MSPGGTYQSRRKRNKGRGGRIALWMIQGVICAAIIGGFGYGLLRWSEDDAPYAVRVVRVEGLNRLEENAILEASGVDMGGNLFAINEADTAAAVERLPYVRSCSVERIFPETLVLRIRERAPVATLMVNSHAYEIDREGVVLREYAALEVPSPPYITNAPEMARVSPGDQLQHAAVHEALRVWTAFADTGMRTDVRVTELAAFHPDEIVMFAEEIPCEVRWGRGDYEVQAARLNVLWEELGRRFEFREYVDLRFGADIVCR